MTVTTIATLIIRMYLTPFNYIYKLQHWLHSLYIV